MQLRFYNSLKYSTFTLTILLSIFLFSAHLHAQGWEWQNPLPQGNDLEQIFFVDSSHGWITAGCNLLRTTDGGENWSLEYIGNIYSANRIHFVDQSHGWLIGSKDYYGIMAKTNDGGKNWEEFSIPNELFTSNLLDIFFADSLHGYVVNSSGRIYYTENGGESWQRQFFILDRRDLESIFFSDSLKGWAAGYTPLYRTTNAGE
ncbi:MAG: YCF48-related protein, partial [Ignavibacteriaceae bacterium]